MGLLSDIFGAITGSTSRDAGREVSNATEQATAEARRQFDTGVSLTNPTRNFQNAATLQLSQLLGLGQYNPNQGIPGASTPGAGTPYGPPVWRGGDIDNRTGRFARGEPDFQAPQQLGGQQTAGFDGNQGSLSDLLRSLPGYQFAVDETVRNANVGAAGRGEFFSGAAGDELNTRLHGVADQTYGNQINRLLASANGGQSAAQTANNAITTGQIVGQNMVDGGQARASGMLGQANTLSGLINSGIGFAAGGGFGGFGGGGGGGGTIAGTNWRDMALSAGVG